MLTTLMYIYQYQKGKGKEAEHTGRNYNLKHIFDDTQWTTVWVTKKNPCENKS